MKEKGRDGRGREGAGADLGFLKGGLFLGIVHVMASYIIIIAITD